jgi:hypothetical protein
MTTFHCPICKEHAKTHSKTTLLTEPEVKKQGVLTEANRSTNKDFKIPDFTKRFLHQTVSITLINGSTISGKLT